jgi:hypothetical protein
MAYNSLRSLDTINAADSTLYTADFIAMTVEKKQNTLPLLPYILYTEYACPPAPPASSAAKNQQRRYNLNSSLILQCNGSTFLDVKIS